FGSLAIGVVTFVAPPIKVPVPVKNVETISGALASSPADVAASRAATGAGGAGRRPVSRRDAGAPLLPLVWLAGFASVVVWSVVGHVTLARVAKRATPADGFRISDEISAPVTCGW